MDFTLTSPPIAIAPLLRRGFQVLVRSLFNEQKNLERIQEKNFNLDLEALAVFLFPPASAVGDEPPVVAMPPMWNRDP